MEPLVTRENRQLSWDLVVRIFVNYGYLVAIAAFLFIDFIPRFWQGDSLSYLSTSKGGWMPPDRSWAFGLFVNYLLRRTHGGSAFMFLQVALLALMITAARVYFFGRGKVGIVYGTTAFLLALDPCLEIYTRFFMSDFLALAFFFLMLLAMFRIMSESGPGKPSWFWINSALLCGFASIWVRVAYAPVIEITVLLCALMRRRCLSRRKWTAIGLSALVPFLALGSIAAANHIVFADQFPHEVFVNRYSGIFLAGIYAPALQKADFAKAGIPITDDELRQLKLRDYNRASYQVWGTSHDSLHQFLKDQLGVKDGDPPAVNKAAANLVRNAFFRNPFAIAKVYVHHLLEYASPPRWRTHGPMEAGLSRPLPDSFVSFWNQYSILKIEPETTRKISPLVQIFVASVYFYPFLLLLGIIAAVYMNVTKQAGPGVQVLTASFVGAYATAPLYSDYVLARYLIAAIVASYLLLGLGVQAVLNRRQAG